MSYPYNVSSALPEIEAEAGYTGCWYDAEEGGNKVDALTAELAEKTLYARQIPNTFTITASAENPTLTRGESVNIVLSDYITLSDDAEESCGTITFSVSDLPAGLSYAEGVISGTPTEVNENGTAVTITATAENGSTAQCTITIIVKAAEMPDTPVTPDYPDYYNIYVEECEGVTVETSTNVVREGNSMSFTIEVAEGYTAEDMVVKVKRSLFGYTDVIEPNEEGKYEIRNIWTEIYITVEGVEKETPTGIEEITESKVYAKDGSLYVQTPKQEQVVIISISGAVIKNETQIGLKRYDLPHGIYIVRVGTQNYKIRN